MRNILLSILVSFSLSSLAQKAEGIPFNGIVQDLGGAPIKKVKIYVKSPDTYTITNKKGAFGLTDVKPTDTLHLSYKKMEYAIPVNGKKSVRITLGDKWQALEDQDLFNAGMEFISKREFTNSANRLSGEQLLREGYTTVMSALRGRVPGLSVGQSQTFSSKNSTSFSIRGESSINATRSPLLLLDGIEVSNYDDVSMSDVDYIEVIKDANSYGIRGSSGVISVFTHKPGK